MQDTIERDRFLSEPHVAILATTGPGKRAHAVPVWYLYEEGRFIMSAGAGSQKVRNIERQGQATLVVDQREVPYYAVMVRGTAQIGPPISEELRLRLAVRYLGEELGRAYVARGTANDSVTIYLQPVNVIEYHGEAGRSESGT